MGARKAISTDDFLKKSDRSTKYAILLRKLIEVGIVEEMVPKKIISSYTPFQNHTYALFQSALNKIHRCYRNLANKKMVDNSGKLLNKIVELYHLRCFFYFFGKYKINLVQKVLHVILNCISSYLIFYYILFEIH